MTPSPDPEAARIALLERTLREIVQLADNRPMDRHLRQVRALAKAALEAKAEN